MAAINVYIRKTGSNNNGGSSAGTSPDRTGTDAVANGTTTITSATGNFTNADIDKLINVVTKGRRRIISVTNSTTIVVDSTMTAGSGLTWNLGGALLTVAQALVSTNATAILGGDTIYIGPGRYGETVATSLTPASEMIIQGDTDGSHTGDAPGKVEITGYTTNDKTAPSGTTLINLGSNDFYTFKNIVFAGGSAGSMVTAAASTATNIKFTDCYFFQYFPGSKSIISVTAGFATPLVWTFTRCGFWGSGATVIIVTQTTGVGADYDLQFKMFDCWIISAAGGIQLTASGASAQKGNGIKLYNCFIYAAGTAINTNNANNGNTIPNLVYNCLISAPANTALLANAAGGLITEDYNILSASTARTSVSAGANSIADGSYNPQFHLGQERLWGGTLRPFLEPITGSPHLAFGNDGSQDATDLLNRPRPAGGLSALGTLGPLERGNTWLKETGTVHTGSNALSITGPGFQEFQVPVDNVSTTLSVYMRFDGTYTGTKPKIEVLNATDIGVAGASSSAVTTVNTWENLTLTFTPTAKGWVTLRINSTDTNGAGKAFADTFAVA